MHASNARIAAGANLRQRELQARSAIWCGSIAAVAAANSASALPDCASRRAPRRCPRPGRRRNSRSIAARRDASGASPRRLCKCRQQRHRRDVAPHSASRKFGKARRRHAMRGERRRDAVGSAEPLAGQRAIGAELARHPRQEPGRADIGKKADADLGHREQVAVAGDAMRAVHREADAAAHHDAVDQRDIGFGIALDEGVERVLLAPERQHLVVAGRRARDRKARGCRRPPRTRARRRRKARSASPPDRPPIALSCARERPHHTERHGIERLRPVQGDEARGAAPLEQDFRVGRSSRQSYRGPQPVATPDLANEQIPPTGVVLRSTAR